MPRFLFFFVCLFAFSAVAEDRALYFSAPSKPGEHFPVGTDPLTFKAGSRLDLELEACTQSVEDQNTFVRLIIDDYRYDEPNYFADKRVPNVSFEVAKEIDGSFKPIPFRTSSQGGGVNLGYLDVHVSFDIGGDPEKLEDQTKMLYQEIAAKTLKPEDAIPRLEAIQRQYASNQPGKYRIRAIYRPNVTGKWKGELTTQPITIVISDAK